MNMKYLNLKNLAMSTALFLSSLQSFAIVPASTTTLEQSHIPMTLKEEPQGQDPFVILENLFAAGTVPTIDDLTGWRTGRCFHIANHFEAYNGLLVGWTSRPNGDPGPLIPQEDVINILSLHRPDKPANVYDAPDALLINEVEQYLAGSSSSFPATLVDGSYNVTFNRHTTWIFRKSGNYVVKKWLSNNVLFGMCYFFNKIR